MGFTIYISNLYWLNSEEKILTQPILASSDIICIMKKLKRIKLVQNCVSKVMDKIAQPAQLQNQRIQKNKNQTMILQQHSNVLSTQMAYYLGMAYNSEKAKTTEDFISV